MIANTKAELLQILNAMKKHMPKTPVTVALRQDRLKRSILLLKENHQSLRDAMSADFGHRNAYQSGVADIATTVKMLNHSLQHVAQWMKPRSFEAPEPEMSMAIEYQPLGVVGVISPWNFPLNLSFGPLAGVFAAGNSAMLKPSELTPRTSELLAELVGHYFGPEELSVVLGDAQTGQAFSELPFDHLVFTGSTAVGKYVMRAAAENLVPVTLELGGKSPVMVAQDGDLQKAVERTLAVKTFNAGQICIAPDYLLLPKNQVEQFTSAAKQFIAESLPTIQENDDYSSIINSRHYERLVGLLNDAKAKGAEIINLGPDNEPGYHPQSRKIAPHLVLGVREDMAIMQEEVFGPLLPVVETSSDDEAMAYINNRPKPLAAYCFSEDANTQTAFAQQTASGAVVFNDVMTHVAIDELPFGGIGPSGMGAYHGVYGFQQFSHAKPIVWQNPLGTSNLRLRAPYKDKQAALEELLNA